MAREHGENCDCMSAVDAKLRERNTRLAISILIDGGALVGRPTIQTEQVIKGRGMPKAVAVTPSYCPFCGTAYGEQENEEADKTDATGGSVHEGERHVEGG